MNKEAMNNRWSAVVPVLTALTAVFVLAAAVLAYLMDSSAEPAPVPGRAQVPLLLERIPFEAQNALRRGRCIRFALQQRRTGAGGP
jgi:hypothetical protein